MTYTILHYYGNIVNTKNPFCQKIFSENSKTLRKRTGVFYLIQTKGMKVEKNITNKFLQTQFTTRSDRCQDWILQIKGSILQILCRFWVLMWLFWLSSVVGCYREGGLGGFVILVLEGSL